MTPGQEKLVARARNLFKEAEAVQTGEGDPGAKLAALANHGDIAIRLLPALCDAVERNAE